MNRWNEERIDGVYEGCGMAANAKGMNCGEVVYSHKVYRM